MMKVQQYIWVALLLFCSQNLLAQSTTVLFDSNSSMQDAFVANGGVEQMNYGSSPQLRAYYESGQQMPMTMRSYIQYDLTSIPSNAIIISAKLRFTTQLVDNTQDHPLYIERVNTSGNWSESSISWSNQPDVITVDRVEVPHTSVANSGVHEFEVTNHVSKMVSSPSINNGWRIRLQQESATTSFGLSYHSSESSYTSDRPQLQVEYMMPVTFSTTLNHCTPGNEDGTFSIELDGGSGQALNHILFYEVVRTSGQPGAATVVNAKTTCNVQFNAATKTITGENLKPGSYMLVVLDDQYYTTSANKRFRFDYNLLVGREGDTTTCILFPHRNYKRYAFIGIDDPTISAPLDRANTNYSSNRDILRVNHSPGYYEFATLVDYDTYFDDQLSFQAADLHVSSYSKFYRYAGSSNAVNFTAVTTEWQEDQVTWNNRPEVDTNLRTFIPKSDYTGYGPANETDTVSLLNMVEYWQQNPQSQFGIEISIDSLGSAFADRTYKPPVNNYHFFEFSYTVKPSPLEMTFDDASNRGTLTVNAPQGNLPYTYLIHTEPIGSLTDAWNALNDTLIVDSLAFFNGSINATTYQFKNLPSSTYYIAVFDNSGTKIMDSSSTVRSTIDFESSTDLDLSSNYEVTRSASASAQGIGRVYGELLANEPWGGIRIEVETIGELSIGFNKTADVVASTPTDLEFGLHLNSSGTYNVVVNNTVTTATGSIQAASTIDILKYYDNYKIYINETEVYSGVISSLDNENAGIDMILTDAVGKLKIKHFWGKFKKPGVHIKASYPSCGEPSGSLTVSKGLASITSCILENNDGVSPNPLGGAVAGSYIFPTVPIGTYTLTVTYSAPPIGPFPGVSYVREEQVAMGYVVKWEDKVGEEEISYVEDYFLIRPLVGYEGVSSANSTNNTYGGMLNWVQFESKVWTPYFLGGGMGLEAIGFRNKSESTETYRLFTGNLFEPITKLELNSGIGVSYTDVDASPSGVWRIEQNEDNFKLFNENVELNTGISSIPGSFDISIYQTGKVEYIKTIASFCSDYPIPDQYVEPKREIEGGYFLVPTDDVLKFEFNEEYVSTEAVNNLSFKVRDYTGAVIAGLPDLEEVYGDNRFSLDVSTLSSGVYIMEIENEKGEDWFIRFKVQ